MKKKISNYIYLKISGVQYQKLFKKFNVIGINIYDYRQNNKDFIIKIKYDDYSKIKKSFPFYDITLIKYDGFNYYKLIVKQYLINIIFIFLSIIFIFFVSNLIVDIKYNIKDQKLIKKINVELSQRGISKFTFKKSYDELEIIKNKILKSLDEDIEWLEITRNGMIYKVDIEKRVDKKPLKKDNYCNVFAKKDGIIKNILISNGVSIVSENDYVKKGDLLISGDIINNEENVGKVCASGIVMGEVWYKSTVKVPLVTYKSSRTGKKRNNIVINYDDYDIKIFRDRLKFYEAEKKLFFDALGIKLYLEHDYEIKKNKIKLSEKEAVEKALKESKEKIEVGFQKTDFIVKQKVLQKKINNSTIEVEIFIVTNENIAG